ncbi:MAG: RluA family pseudouridine synthase [Rubrimonas sp.]|uniref:RluA family pseudouridine synthase n=1 Tax=Rubrimonas sp. TaxID=2036015 RepID=UPI002FDD84A7
MRLVALRAGRLDAALSPEGISRSRLAALILAGALTDESENLVTNPALKVKPGASFTLRPPAPVPAAPAPEAIALSVAHEDAHLIVVDKPAGMVVHPAPGATRGTLVAALLHHCGASLSGVGGVARPGIVHRIDKDTSGLLVVAKTDAAHAGLAVQFAAHDLERSYLAVVWGAPDRAEPRLAGLKGVSFEPEGWIRVEAAIARHRADRKRMAVVAGGRRAVTRLRVEERFGPAERPVASLIRCRLETGRTHQIRVHLTALGHPLVGDPVYGRPRPAPACARDFPRQALHAATLGFVHPATGAPVRCESPVPDDMAALLACLRAL